MEVSASNQEPHIFLFILGTRSMRSQIFGSNALVKRCSDAQLDQIREQRMQEPIGLTSGA